MSKTPDMKAFMEAYSRLNAAQREAVDTIDGPVMVVAGPGTGKTQILTLRIANILRQTDMRPENILALTFTESGALAMRERLLGYIGQAAYKVGIFTFHGFAGRLIAEYPDAFPRVIGGRAATDIEKVSLLETILTNPAFTILRPFGNPTYYVPYILRMISTCKQEYISPDKLASLLVAEEGRLAEIPQYHTKGAHKGKVRGEYSKAEKNLEKNREFLAVYREYEALLSVQKLYDFDDMLIEAVQALSSSVDMLRDLQESYQYVLADEHQDVNGSQNKLLELLCNFHDSPNIFVVGDEKQAIYRFQGASLENFLYFVDLFPTTKQIVLTENYRSGQSILDISHELMQTEDPTLQAMRLPLKAAAVEQASVERRNFSHQAVEDDWLVASCQAELASGTPHGEIAIIVRTNREVETLSTRLRQAGLPVTASAEGDVLDHPITKSVQALIDFVLTDRDEQPLFTVLHGAYWGLSTADIVKITGARSYENSLTSILTSPEKLIALGVENVEAALGVMAVLVGAREREVHEAPHRVLEYILDESGFLDHVMKYDPFEGVRVVRRLYDEVEAMVIRDGVSTLRAVSDILALRRHYSLPLSAPYIATNSQAIQIMTAHKSKGLEFGVVFVPHLQDNAWGGKTKRNMFSIDIRRSINKTEFDPLDDERRLLYVALTRAKHRLCISSAEHSILGKDTDTSRLLTELSPEAFTVVPVTEAEEAFSPITALRHVPGARAITATVLTKLLYERGFSATSLNNYLKNPWDFVYRNMLRIPEVQPLHMQFGTVVHNVLQKTTARHTKLSTWPTDTEVIDWLTLELRKLPVNQAEYTRLHEKGIKILFGYLTHLQGTLMNATKEELSVSVVLQTGIPALPQLKLTGKLDRIDLSPEGYALRVVDYKTGKPKTRAVIEGTTAASDGAYKRQLTFYALLLSLYDDERYRTTTGVLSFVEPQGSGEIREESFLITQKDIDDLTTEIKNAVEAITTGAFLADEKLVAESEYAGLVSDLLNRPLA